MGWFLTMPNDFFRHVRQALSSLAFGSNITFGGERGYFDAAAHTKPLLHTWSLSIEWQFYLLLPMVLFVIWQFSPNRKKLFVLTNLIVLALASMAWCFWTSQLVGGADFFSLRTRSWELLVGSVVASLHQINKLKAFKLQEHTHKNIQIICVLIGWVMVFMSSFCADAGSWPSPMTLLPVFGTALIVFAGRTTSVFKIVTHSAPVQLLGDASYSIYLWHWPLWVFAQQWASYSGESITFAHKLGLVILTIALSYLSLRFIEQRVRLSHDAWTPRRLWYLYGCSLAVFSIFTLVAVKTRGFPHRIPDYQQRAELARKTNTPRDECFRNPNSEKEATPQFCDFGAKPSEARVSAILWGDSLANQYIEPVSAGALRLGIHGFVATQSACRAMLIEKAGDSGRSVKKCTKTC